LSTPARSDPLSARGRSGDDVAISFATLADACENDDAVLPIFAAYSFAYASLRFRNDDIVVLLLSCVAASST
jgi:hypothetical protein